MVQKFYIVDLIVRPIRKYIYSTYYYFLPSSSPILLKFHHATMDNPIFSSLSTIAVYAPVVLFTESLRVQRAMVTSVLSPCSIAPAITGCVKDLYRLWSLDDVQLFGNFEDERAACVASIQHGNIFPLHNQTVLQLAGLLKGKFCAANAVVPYTPAIGGGFSPRRETVVNLSFVLPHEAGSGGRGFCWLQGVCWAVTLVEVVAPLIIAVYMTIWGEVTGVVLMTGFSLSVLILAILRFFTQPIIANQDEISKFRKDAVNGLSTLDIHIIATNWNTKHLDVVCGYSKHLHALTNMSMAINRPGLLRGASMGLVVVLLVQAASLASLIGNKDNAWLCLTWLAMYISMSIPPQVFNSYRSKSIYKSHTDTLIKVPSIRFSGRRTALVFISLLPIARRADVPDWAWMDGFIPDNERRRIWTAQVESLDPVTLEYKSSKYGQTSSETTNAVCQKVKDIVREANAAYHHPRVLQPLLSYKTAVGL